MPGSSHRGVLIAITIAFSAAAMTRCPFRVPATTGTKNGAASNDAAPRHFLDRYHPPRFNPCLSFTRTGVPAILPGLNSQARNISSDASSKSGCGVEITVTVESSV